LANIRTRRKTCELPEDGQQLRPKHVEAMTYLLTYSMQQSPS